jgi:uncharacterized protein YukE
MPDGNPLVAQRQDSTTAYSGIGIAESAMDVYHGVENKSWIEGGLGVAGTGLEALSLAMDPVGTLLQYAVSWLMEHVKPLSDALDWLAGDADQIAAYAQTWKNVGQETTAIAGDLAAEITNGTAGWTGAAADAYRARAKEQQDKITAAGTGANTIGTVVEVVGVLVGAVREIVRDLVAECVATLIARIPQWVAEIGGTLGIATPHVVASAVSLIAKWVNRIKDFITKLTRSLEKLRPIMTKLGEIWEAIRKAARRAPDGAPSSPDAPNAVKSPAGSTTPSGTTTPDTPSTPDTPHPKPDADTTSSDMDLDTPGSGRPTGGRQRPNPNRWDYDPAKEQAWADDAYDSFRGTNRDVDMIAENLSDAQRLNGGRGFSPEEIGSVKKHLMEDEHMLYDYDTDSYARSRFQSDPDIADAWIRMSDGRARPEDIKLLEHELAEQRYMVDNPGASYRDAHQHANSVSNWEQDVPEPTREHLDDLPWKR